MSALGHQGKKSEGPRAATRAINGKF